MLMQKRTEPYVGTAVLNRADLTRKETFGNLALQVCSNCCSTAPYEGCG